MPYGVTSTGFVVKPLEDILSEIESDQRSRISQSLNTESESPLGQVNGTIGSIIAELWEVAESDYNATSILTATGQALDRLVALSTLTRAAATTSSVTVTLNLDATTTVAAGKQARVSTDPDAVFELVSAVTSTTAGDYTGQMTSVSTGPVRANAGTLDTIVTPVTGWNSVTNAEDAVLGSNIESDSALRARYTRSAGGKGLRTLQSIIQAVEAVTNVSAALVFENPTDDTDPVNGITPHSIEVVIDDGNLAVDNDVAQAIWDTKAAGIDTYGSDSGTATDALSNSQTVSFNHVTVKDIHVEVTIVTSADFSGSEGSTGLKTAIADWGDSNLSIGEHVIISQLTCPVFDFGGVEDVVQVRVSLDSGGTPSGWQTTNLVIQPRERADLDTGRITIIIQ